MNNTPGYGTRRILVQVEDDGFREKDTNMGGKTRRSSKSQCWGKAPTIYGIGVGMEASGLLIDSTHLFVQGYFGKAVHPSGLRSCGGTLGQ